MFEDGYIKKLTLHQMNHAQLQIVVNDLHTQIEGETLTLSHPLFFFFKLLLSSFMSAILWFAELFMILSTKIVFYIELHLGDQLLIGVVLFSGIP